MFCLLFAGASSAQDSPVVVTGGVDVPSLYYFRGIRQEVDPKFTMWPWVDVGVPIRSGGDGAVQSVNLNIGSWNSIHTGSNKDVYDGAFYESDFYATLSLGLQNALTLATTYTAYTYPAPDFDAIHEIMFKLSSGTRFAPYGLVAFEFKDCDGCDKGTYAELGIGPSFPLTDTEGGPTLAIPVKLGLDLNKYYGGDEGFAFFDIGGLITYPLQNGWSVRAGADFLALSDTLEAFNINDDLETSKTGFVVMGGVGFSF
jgi:hypothetical protein